MLHCCMCKVAKHVMCVPCGLGYVHELNASHSYKICCIIMVLVLPKQTLVFSPTTKKNKVWIFFDATFVLVRPSVHAYDPTTSP